jgi:hypothetical protein
VHYADQDRLTKVSTPEANSATDHLDSPKIYGLSNEWIRGATTSPSKGLHRAATHETRATRPKGDSTLRKHNFGLVVAVCICLFAPEVFGQSPPPASASEGWNVRLTPYLFGSGFKGRVGIGDHSANVDASFKDILHELNFAFMGAIEADKNRFVTTTDLMYINLSDEHGVPGPLFSEVNAIEKSFILTPQAGYRIVGSRAAFLDVLGGIRWWRVNGELHFQPGRLSGLDLSDTRNWVDGIFALKAKVDLSPTWYITGYGDIGGGGSNLTYQILGVAGANIGSRSAFVFGYRYLNVAYNKDAFLFDTAMQGPVIGFAFKF